MFGAKKNNKKIKHIPDINIRRCQCGNIGSSNCLFKVCEKCCISDYCDCHNKNKQNKKLDDTTCFICLTDCNETNMEDLKKFNDKYNYCENCYILNKNIFDMVLFEQSFTSVPMFYVSKMQKCICVNTCSQKCCLKLCKKCCNVKECLAHKTNTKTNNNNIYIGCTFCLEEKIPSELNNYMNLQTNEIIYYCKKCYEKHNTRLNTILLQNIETEQYNNLHIKPSISLDEVVIYKKNKERQLQEEKDKKERQERYEKERKENFDKEVGEYNKFIEGYKDTIITKDLIKNELSKNEYFCVTDIMTSEYNFQCPVCDDIVLMEDVYCCKKCNDLGCGERCIRTEHIMCPYKNCSYCRTGNCFNNSIEEYCVECYVDVNKNFYDKYKNTILTASIISTIKSEENMINLYDFSSNNNYRLKYKCPVCKKNTNFESYFIRDCDQCNNYVCMDCSINKYIKCGYYNCKYCVDRTCYNSEIKIFCTKCKPEYFNGDYKEGDSDEDDDFEDDDFEDDDFEDDDFEDNFKLVSKLRSNSLCEIANDINTQCNVCLVNVKNYACIPCGHLCLCGNCANYINKNCPICKNKFDIIIKIIKN